MSFHRIHCDGCGKSNMFFITISISSELLNCPCCHDIKEYHKHSHHFCDLECMKKWLAYHNVLEEGFPCRDCVDYQTGKPTGFMAGFPSNGTCRVCKGTMRISKQTSRQMEIDPERLALQAVFTKEIEAAGGYEAYCKKKNGAEN